MPRLMLLLQAFRSDRNRGDGVSSWLDGESHDGFTPEQELWFLERRRLRRIVYAVVSLVVLIVAIVAAVQWNRIEVVALRAPEVIALGVSLGGLLNTLVALIQLRITIVQIAALREQIRVTSETRPPPTE